jgi:rhamnose utilization protein RhaD (predicted bifunctional aldolase and dehydrogenase)/NAD(P)-dependent dehydrogenase (short-subunit alcohol dehydrogenase family)
MPETIFVPDAKVTHLKYLWNDEEAERLKDDPIGLLRYRSNLLGADLRITNFGGGNTSSKIELPDPFTGKPVRVLAVKGSGGDLGSIKDSGFALLYLDRLEQLKEIYRGEEHEDEMVGYYPLSAFGQNKVAASIDTPLHAFIPYPHVDHLHPDWAIALAASANGKRKLEEFNKRYNRKIVWLHWQRPGFELGLQLEQAIARNPGCDGVLLGSHGLFTWGKTQRECYLNSIQTIDQMGEFILAHQSKQGEAAMFGGVLVEPLEDRKKYAAAILPALRGVVSSNRRNIAHYDDSEDALRFAGSAWGKQLGTLGTSCPDHFLRTRISPMFIDWNPAEDDLAKLKSAIAASAAEYRADYAKYYSACATPDSPKLRDANPSVVIIPGLGLFGFGKNKKEARITTEFFVNAIHVMAGANALEESDAPADAPVDTYPQSRHPHRSHEFESFHNYVALPRTEAFRIEYWALEEAKLQRMPPEAEFSRKIFLVVGGGSGIGREVALLLAKKGAHLVVADMNAAATEEVAREAGQLSSPDQVGSCAVDIGSSVSIRAAMEHTVLQFGGVDGVINTAEIFPVPAADGLLSEAQWAKTFHVNVTGNFLLAKETERVLREQNLSSVMVLTSSANAVVPKKGSEAYDVSKSALNHLIRELAVGMGPLVRVNGIAPATVVAGSTMFPRDRVIVSLSKYGIAFSEDETTEELRDKLAEFYAQRTITRKPILPRDCAAAIVWLASDESAKTTGHIIPVDGGLWEAFLR